MATNILQLGIFRDPETKQQFLPYTHYTGVWGLDTYVSNRIKEIVGAAPEALNTLEEIAKALKDNPDVLATYLPLVGGIMSGNINFNEYPLLLRPVTGSSYQGGIGWDRKGNEALSLWAQNSVTRLRWYAGITPTNPTTQGWMMDITPDFEVKKVDNVVSGYLQGKQIATVSNLDNYLPLSGSTIISGKLSGITMTGRLGRIYSTVSTDPFLYVGSDNQDVTLLRVYSHNLVDTNFKSTYGYSLKYLGANSGVANYLNLYADNTEADNQSIAIGINQTGQVGIMTTPNTSYALTVGGTLLADKIVKKDGTSAQALMADGSVKTVVGASTSSWITSAPVIPTIGITGVMEVGKYQDWHYNASDTNDYAVRVQTPNVTGVEVTLPSASGTLALKSDIGTYAKGVSNGGNLYIGVSNIKVSTTSGAQPITTAQFVSKLTNMGMIGSNKGYAVNKCWWSYVDNDYISDTNCGLLSLAGAVIECFNSGTTYHIRVTPPITTNVKNSVTQRIFIYNNQGSDYYPGWWKVPNHLDIPTVNNATYSIKTLVGSTTTTISDFTANQSSADDITFVQGSNVTLTPDATNRKITIAATDTTYSSKAAASGGTDVSLVTTGEKYTWNSKTNNTGTVTSVTLKATSPISIDSTDAITSSGTRTFSHANSGVTAGTYKSVTVNATGHVTGGTNPTTLSGYGITDAKIANGVITLGSNTITPITSHQTVTGISDLTLSTTKQTYLTVGSNTYGIKLPSTNPYTTLPYIDTRSSAFTPTTAAAVNGIRLDFKTKANGVNVSGTYNGILTLDPYSDVTGGYPIQLGFDTSLNGDSNLYLRNAKTADTWNSWKKLLDSGNTYISNGTITINGTSITPLTSHQSVTNSKPTLAWGTTSTVGTIGSTALQVTMPSNPNTNTTYTFESGTNGFKVTPSGGIATTVTVTPSITNNITGSGTSGYIAKFNGTNTITNGPAFGSSTTTYLRNDGSWATPTDTNTDTKVTQSVSSTNAGFSILLKNTNNFDTETAEVKFAQESKAVTVNPGNGTVTAPAFAVRGATKGLLKYDGSLDTTGNYVRSLLTSNTLVFYAYDNTQTSITFYS